MAMTMEEMEAGIRAIPEKKESLRKAFDHLLSSSFPLPFRWDDLDAHISSLQATISHRFQQLQAREAANGKDKDKEEKEEEPTPRAALVSVCAGMEAQGLIDIPSKNRKERVAIWREFLPALRHSPDPPKLVLDAVKGIFSKKTKRDRDWETCVALLECLPALAAAPAPQITEEAKKVAADWKEKISKSHHFEGLAALGLLNLLVSYSIISVFSVDDIIRLFGIVPRRQKSVHLCITLGLADRVTDLIDHLVGEGRQLDAAKFVHAFNLAEKYPLVPLLKAYAKRAKEAAQDILNNGMNTFQSQNEAIAKEVSALKSIQKAVEEYNLNSEYPHHTIKAQIGKLLQKASKKRSFADASTASSSKSQQQNKQHKKKQKQQQQKPQEKQQKPQEKQQQMQNQSNKWSWPSTTATPVSSAPIVLPPVVQIQPQIGLHGHSPHSAMPGVYNVGARGSLHSYPSQTLSGIQSGFAAPPVRPHQYMPVPSIATSGLVYDKLAPYNPYRPSSSYSPSVYPM